MRVERERLAEQRPCWGARTSPSKRGERPGVAEPGGVPVTGVGGEQLIEFIVLLRDSIINYVNRTDFESLRRAADPDQG